MKKGIFVVLLLVMIVWASIDFWQTTKQTIQNESTDTMEVGLQRGKLAPDFRLDTIDGEGVRLSDYRGKPVIINFWATWCPPCRAEIPDLQAVHNEGEAIVLAVNMTASEQNEQVVSQFIRDLKMTFPVVLDRDEAVLDLYRVQAYPTSYIIDQQGVVQFVAVGAMNEEQIRKELQKIK